MSARKKLGCTLAIVGALGLIGLFCFAVRQFSIRTALDFSSPKLFVATCPGTGNQAHFVTQGFQDRAIILYVLPADGLKGKPVLVADVDLDPDLFGIAVWSGDGSVIACRGRNASQDVYSYVYDFARNEVLMPKGVSAESIKLSSPIDWQSHTTRIEKLLESRGGLGQKVTRSDILAGSTSLNWTQWQAYRLK